MIAILLALATALSYGWSDYAGGLAARRVNVIRVCVTAEVSKAVLILCIVPFAGSQEPGLASLALGAAAGISGVAGTVTLCLGFRFAVFSVTSSASALSAATVSVLIGLLLGERLSPLSLVGVTLALPAILALCFGRGPQVPPDGKVEIADSGASLGRRPALGAGCGLAAGVAFGLSLACLHRTAPGAGLWPLVTCELAAVATVASVAVVTGELAFPPPGSRWLCISSGVVAAAGILCYFLATHRGSLAITAVIYSYFPAGTIIFARIFLREKLTAKGMAGLCLTAVSVGLIAASASR